MRENGGLRKTGERDRSSQTALLTRIRLTYYSPLPREGVPAQVWQRPSEMGEMAIRGNKALWPVHFELHRNFRSHPHCGV
jgi:hypothetical protein